MCPWPQYQWDRRRKINPENASCIECVKSCMAAVLSVWGENSNDYNLGARRMLSVRYSSEMYIIRGGEQKVIEDWGERKRQGGKVLSRWRS